MTKKSTFAILAATALLGLGAFSLPVLRAQDDRPPRPAEESWRAPAPRGGGDREGRREGNRPPPPRDEMGMGDDPPPPPMEMDGPGREGPGGPPRIGQAVGRAKAVVERIRREERDLEQRRKALESADAEKATPEQTQRRKRILELRTELIDLEKKEVLDRAKEQTARALEELDERAAEAGSDGPPPEMLERLRERLQKVSESTGDFDQFAKAVEEMPPPPGGRGEGPGGRFRGPEGPEGREGPEGMERREWRERGERHGPADSAQMERIEREMEMLNRRIERLQQQMGRMEDAPAAKPDRKARQAGKPAPEPSVEGVPPTAAQKK